MGLNGTVLRAEVVEERAQSEEGPGTRSSAQSAGGAVRCCPPLGGMKVSSGRTNAATASAATIPAMAAAPWSTRPEGSVLVPIDK
jgi:hypothetical protein